MIFGSGGEDVIAGNLGDDVIDGGSGADSITGDEGADTIFGSAGADEISGGAGVDVIDGGADADTIHGGADGDTITGGTGDDTIAGGEGDDVAVFHGVQDDFTFAVAPNGTLTVTDLNTNTAFGVDTISEVETLRFTDGDLTVTTTSSGDVISLLARMVRMMLSLLLVLEERL